MSIVLEPKVRQSLQGKAGEIKELLSPRVVEAGEGDLNPSKRRAGWLRGLQDAVLDLANDLPAGIEDYEARLLLTYTTQLARAVEEDESGMDPEREVLLWTRRTGDVVRRMIRQLKHSSLEKPEVAATYVFEQFSEQPIKDLAPVLGVSAKTAGKWKKGEPIGNSEDRLVLVAQLVSYLRFGFTQKGMMLWFMNPAPALGGRSPLEILDESLDKDFEQLTGYARAGRGQLAG